MFYFLTIIIKKGLMKTFRNGILIICKFSDHNINKFILLLHKGVYQYDCIDDWNLSDKNLLPQKKILTVT